MRKMIRIGSFRKSLIVGIASLALLVVANSEAGSQTVGKRDSEKPTEMAEALAHAIDMKMKVPKTPNPPLSFESATSHDNVVELHYRANEVLMFPHDDAERELRRLQFAYRFCFDRRMGLLGKPGVVVHQVLAPPDGSAPFEFTIDEATCATIVAEIDTRVAGMKRPKSVDEPKGISTIRIRPDPAK